MPHYIAHRINTLSQLRQLPTGYGVEIDLRDRGERIILQHDPFCDGEDFEAFAGEYKHGTMILNIKSERIEHRVLEILNNCGISDYFFLDCTFPMIHLLSSQGERNIAVRFSEIEPIENALALKGRCSWVWVDCFTRLPISKAIETRLHEAGFKLCLVSPELVGRKEDLPVYKKTLLDEGIEFDAICTKAHMIPAWEGELQ